MRQPLVVFPREIGHVPPAASLIGKKAHGLAQLQTLKARVPRFGVVTVGAFDAFVAQPSLQLALIQARQAPLDTASLTGVGEKLVRDALAQSLPDEVFAGIAELRKSFADDDLFAVRASVVGEDLVARALAAHLDAALATRDLEGCVHRLFALAFHPRTLRALAAAGLPAMETRLAVVIQRHVPSEQSGACLTLDPDDATDVARQPRAALRACLGLAGGIGGRAGNERIACDRYAVLRPAIAEDGLADDARVTVAPVRKPDALRQSEGGTRMIAVAADEQERPSLTTVQARLVVKEALRLEAALGKPQVISFAFAGRLLHILDVEPLLVPGRRIDSARLRVWDERLVPAPLARPATVLSFSVWQRAVARGFERAGRIAGVRGPMLEELRPHFRRALGVITGRITGNVDVLSALVDLLPFAEKARTALAHATGQPELSARTDGGVFVNGKKARSLWARARDKIDEGRWPGQLERLAQVSFAESTAFLDEVDTALQTPSARDVEGADPDVLCDAFEVWTEHLGRCVAALTLSGVVTSLVEQLLIAELTALKLAGLRADLLIADEAPAHERDDVLASTRRLQALARLIDADPELASVCRDGGVDALRDSLGNDPAFQALNAGLAALIDLDPPESTLLLEEPRLRERPTQVLSQLLRVWRSPRTDLVARMRDASGRRKKAEYAVEAACQSLPMLEATSTKKRVLALVQLYRRHAALSARAWLPTERVVATLRAHALALGERLFEHELLEQSRDVFSLQDAEIGGVIRGTGPDTDVRPLVVARRRAAAVRPPGHALRTETRGVVATSLLSDDDEDSAMTSPGAVPTLVAVTAASGEARGAVQFAHDATDSNDDGGVSGVVVAGALSFTELPLWACAQAVVVERGTALSPVAMALGRLGVPTLVQTPSATLAFRAGEVVIVDAANGAVHREAQKTRDASADASAKPAAAQEAAAPSTSMPPASVPGGAPVPTAPSPTTPAPAPQPMGAFLRDAIATDPAARPKRRADKPAAVSSEMPAPPAAGFFEAPRRDIGFDIPDRLPPTRSAVSDEAAPVDESDVVESSDAS